MLGDVVQSAALGVRADPTRTLSFLKKRRVPPGIIQSLEAYLVPSFIRVGRLNLLPLLSVAEAER